MTLIYRHLLLLETHYPDCMFELPDCNCIETTLHVDLMMQVYQCQTRCERLHINVDHPKAHPPLCRHENLSQYPYLSMTECPDLNDEYGRHYQMCSTYCPTRNHHSTTICFRVSQQLPQSSHPCLSDKKNHGNLPQQDQKSVQWQNQTIQIPYKRW